MYKSNTKLLLKLINKCSGKLTDKCSIIDYLTDGIKKIESLEIADEFVKFSSGIGREYSNKIGKATHSAEHYLNKIQGCNKSLFMYCTNNVEIDQIIKKLVSKTSSGHDGISNRLLKDLGSSLSHPLQIVFNKSLTLGQFPHLMKLADVPLYKNKNRDLCTNYRPISLLLTISKILEKIVYKHTYSFLVKNNKIFTSQYGFRSKHSCENAVTELTSKVLKGSENKKMTLSIFLDLSKVFDMLSHNLLL